MSGTPGTFVYRTLLSHCLRRVENLQDELAEGRMALDEIAVIEALAEIRGILATVLQWEIETTVPARIISTEDIPF